LKSAMANWCALQDFPARPEGSVAVSQQDAAVSQEVDSSVVVKVSGGCHTPSRHVARRKKGPVTPAKQEMAIRKH
jgi:hypothetical protein